MGGVVPLISIFFHSHTQKNDASPVRLGFVLAPSLRAEDPGDQWF